MTEMQTKQSTKQKLKSHATDSKKLLSLGTVVALIILMTPLLFYSYQGFPDTETWDSFLGTYQSQYYGSTQVFFWVLFGKVIPFLLLVLWFLTCKHWWYHVIIVPIGMYIIQIYSTLNQDIKFADSEDIYFIIPIIAIIAAISYNIRIKIFDSLYGVDFGEGVKKVKWNGKIVKVPASSTLDLEEVDEDDLDDPGDRNEEEEDDDEPMWMA